MTPTITYITTRLTQLHHNIKDLEDKLAQAIEERDSHEAAIKLIEENGTQTGASNIGANTA